jgi:hypothetical protein
MVDIEQAPKVFLIEVNPLVIHFHFICFMIFIYSEFIFCYTNFFFFM